MFSFTHDVFTGLQHAIKLVWRPLHKENNLFISSQKDYLYIYLTSVNLFYSNKFVCP